MVRLVWFEYRKHFIKPSILVALLVFSFISIIKIYGVYSENSIFARGRDNREIAQTKQFYWSFYEELGGAITQDKIEQLMAIYRPLETQTADHTASTATDNPNTYTGNVYNDFYFFDRCFVRPMKYDYLYRSYASQVASSARDNMIFYLDVGNTYEYRKNAAIAKSFSGREIHNFIFTEMYQYYIHYDFSPFLVLLICLYGLVGVFVSEKETEMDTLILTTKWGSFRTIVAKLLSSALFVIGICTWFWMLDFLTFSAVFGSFEGSVAPLYAIKNFADTSLNLSLGQYAILSGCLKTSGMLVLSMGILLLSCLFHNALLPFTLGLAGVIRLIYLNNFYMGSGYLFGKVATPFTLMVNRNLFRKAEYMNLFGYAVPVYIVALLIAALWGAAFTVLLTTTVRKNMVTRKEGRKDVL